jgi:hypothetical protein
MPDPVHWLYPVNAKSGFTIDDLETGTDVPVTPQSILRFVELNGDKPDLWELSSGYRTMAPDDVLWVYAAGLQAIVAIARVYGVQDDGLDRRVQLGWSIAGTRALNAQPISRAAIGNPRVQNVQRASPRATAALASWLEDQDMAIRQTGPDDIPLSAEDARFRNLRAVVTRQGQPAFRAQLLDAYDGACAITGEQVEDVLEAAHIQPYRGSHTNSVTNGLLLRADLHTLFDRHLIAVSEAGRVLVSASLDGTSYEALGGCAVRQPKAKRAAPSIRALQAHRAEFVDDMR